MTGGGREWEIAGEGDLVAWSPGIVEARFAGWRPPGPVDVSVCVQTYQHVPYIDTCLQKICTQQTDFTYEVLVGEDASTDGTRAICLEWAQRYPDRIRLLLHDRTQVISINGVATGRFNLLTNLRRAQGRYIAFCEGDDYWRDPLKLQKQVEFLDAHPGHMFAYHDAVEVDERGTESNRRLLGPTLCYDRPRERVVAGDGMPTASVIFRRELIDRLPPGFRKVMNADTYLFSFGGQFGRAGYVDVAPSCYRVHSGGIWSIRSQIFRLRSNLHTFQTLYPDLQHDFRPIVGYQISRGYNRLIGSLVRAGEWREAARTAAAYLAYCGRVLGPRSVIYQLRWHASVSRRWFAPRTKARC